MVVVIGSAVAALYRFTRFGLATRAAAENAKGATLLGPLADVGSGSATGSSPPSWPRVAGVLMSPISGVNPFNYSLFVVPALAAALAGRLRSFGVAMAVGVAIGMFEGLAVHLVSRRQVPDFLLGGIDTVVPFVAIVGVLVVAGRSVPDRGTHARPALHPEAPMPRRRPVVVGAARRRPVRADGVRRLRPLRLAAITSMMVAIICLSIVLLTGYLGQVSLAQLTLVGFCAFVLARASTQWGLPFPLAPLVARRRHDRARRPDQPAGAADPRHPGRHRHAGRRGRHRAAAVPQPVVHRPGRAARGWRSPRCSAARVRDHGVGRVPVPAVRVLRAGADDRLRVLVVNVRRGRIGRRMLAVRANERAAAASGVRVAGVKLQAAALVVVRRRARRAWCSPTRTSTSRGPAGGVAGAADARPRLPRRRDVGVGRAHRRGAGAVGAAAGGARLTAGGGPAAAAVGRRPARRHGQVPRGLAGAGPWARRELRLTPRPTPRPSVAVRASEDEIDVYPIALR